MKILHISKKFPPALGGDAVVVANLRQQQQKAGNEVVIVTSNCEGIAKANDLYTFGLKDSPMLLDMITPRRLLSLMMLFFQMFSILRTERPDVVHTHSVDIAFVASAAAHFYGIPIVHTFHIVTFYDNTQSLIRRKSELWLIRLAAPSIATAPNKYDVDILRKAGINQTVLLPNGVDLPFWQTYVADPACEPDSQDNECFLFLTFGRLEPQKGYEYLIRAASFVAHTLPISFKVIIIGEGSQETYLRELIISQHVDDIVTIAGRKSPKEVRQLLAQADATVFPSLYETTPLTVLEAWAASVPVVASSVGILRDNLDDRVAYVVPPGDYMALATAMSQCMTDGYERTTIAAQGHKEAIKYAWPKIARQAEKIYQSAKGMRTLP